MSIQTIIHSGEYLGYCEEKGYIYSMFTGYDKKGKKKYTIFAIKNGYASQLIEFTAII